TDRSLAGIADLAPPGLNRIFFSTGGSIANETAVQTAHHYFRLQGRGSKRFVLSVDQVVRTKNESLSVERAVHLVRQRMKRIAARTRRAAQPKPLGSLFDSTSS
ncbi:MAG: hypothetical protein OXK16_05335, partial [bacterium]|nr:hypothetical protein [bacterium]